MKRVLLIDDERWRYEKLSTFPGIQTHWVTNEYEFRHAPRWFGDYDLTLLDYDLLVHGEYGNSVQIAHQIKARPEKYGQVVIHSWNPEGSKLLSNVLPDAYIVAFGPALYEWLHKYVEGGE